MSDGDGAEVTPPERMTEAQRLIAAGRLLMEATIVSSDPPPIVRELWDRQKDPRPGDLVWERSTRVRSLQDPEHAATAVGWFVRRDSRPVATREQWEDPDQGWRDHPGQPYEECDTEPTWVIRPWFDQDAEFEWVNAEFLVLPLGWEA